MVMTPTKTITLEFDGYWREPTVNGIPNVAGIYSVYGCIYDPGTSMVDIRRLRSLRAVADHGTLAAAADALHLTPSAVSQQLAALEREVGHPLLEPAGRSVRLTAAAKHSARRKSAIRRARLTTLAD